MQIVVNMTERASYSRSYDLDTFAGMVLEDGRRDGESDVDLVARLKALRDEEPSSDYGIRDCDNLLDHVLEKGFVSVSDRDWEFEWPEEIEAVTAVAGVAAPQHAPDWED